MTSPQRTPVVTEMAVVPIAGHDSMLLNLSGAHAPYFTRNLVLLTDSDGRTGVGEVPGGEPIRRTLEDARALGATVHTVSPAAEALPDRASRRNANSAIRALPTGSAAARQTLGICSAGVVM